MKFRYILVQCLVFFSMGASAHNPDISSTLLVEESDNQWVLQIRAALTAFEYEIESHFGESSYATPEEFQELVIQHVSERLSIQFNDGSPVILKNGMVKLGHETSVTFKLSETPQSIESLVVKNSSFNDIPRNQSALIVLKKGFAKDQFTLDRKNDHTAVLSVQNSKFNLVIPTEEKKINFSLFILGAALVMGCSLYFLYNNDKKSKFKSSLINDIVSA